MKVICFIYYNWDKWLLVADSLFTVCTHNLIKCQNTTCLASLVSLCCHYVNMHAWKKIVLMITVTVCVTQKINILLNDPMVRSILIFHNLSMHTFSSNKTICTVNQWLNFVHKKWSSVQFNLLYQRKIHSHDEDLQLQLSWANLYMLIKSQHVT